MHELPVASHLALEAVRRQFDPTAPAQPDREYRLVRQAREAAAAVLMRVARVVAPGPHVLVPVDRPG